MNKEVVLPAIIIVTAVSIILLSVAGIDANDPVVNAISTCHEHFVPNPTRDPGSAIAGEDPRDYEPGFEGCAALTQKILAEALPKKHVRSDDIKTINAGLTAAGLPLLKATP